MSELPGAQRVEAAYQKPLGDNAFLQFVQQPRILLLLLAAWAIVGVLTEMLTSNSIFFDNDDHEIDGLLAGRALAWQGIPLAALYLYCFRNPERYRSIFWLALIEQTAAIVANVYHWGAGDFSVESIIVPIAVAAGLGLLSFLNIFQTREQQASV